LETDLTTQLSIEEKANLENLEGAIKRELGSFIVVGNALITIRDQKLYREQFRNFKAYCMKRWGMGRSHANRLMSGAQVAANFVPNWGQL